MYYFYEALGYVVDSGKAFDELTEINNSGKADIVIIYHELHDRMVTTLDEHPEIPYYEWQKDYFFLHNSYGIIGVFSNGEIYVKCDDYSDRHRLLHFVSKYGVATFAMLHNRMSFSCSALCMNAAGMIIMGDSGCGKSTLMGQLVLNGALFVGDDAFAMSSDDYGDFLMHPPLLQLKFNGELEEKLDLDIDNMSSVENVGGELIINMYTKRVRRPTHIRTIFEICTYDPEDSRHTGQVEIVEMAEEEVLSKLLNKLYLDDLFDDTGINWEQYKLAHNMVRQCKRYKVYRPEGLNTAKELAKAVANVHIRESLAKNWKRADLLDRERYFEFLRKGIEAGNLSPELLDGIPISELIYFARQNKLMPMYVSLIEQVTGKSYYENIFIRQYLTQAPAIKKLEYKRIDCLAKIYEKSKVLGLKPVILGDLVFADLYADYGSRTSECSHILIAGSERNTFVSMLIKLGYKQSAINEDKGWVDLCLKNQRMVLHTIRVHTEIWDSFSIVYKGFLNKLCPITTADSLSRNYCGVDCYALDRTNEFVYLIFQTILRFKRSQETSRSFIDFAFYLDRYQQEIDWKRFWKLVFKLKYDKFIQHYFYILIQEFDVGYHIMSDDTPINEEIVQFIEEDMLCCGLKMHEASLLKFYSAFEMYIEEKHLDKVSYDGKTIPDSVLPVEKQKHIYLSARIDLLKKLNLLP